MLSTDHLVSSGVIQGSALGLLLFTTYLFDLVQSQIKCFADDCKIYAIKLVSSNQLKLDLHNIKECSKPWEIRLNELKCTILRVGSDNPNEEYVINNAPLATEEQNDLGVIMASDIKYSKDY